MTSAREPQSERDDRKGGTAGRADRGRSGAVWRILVLHHHCLESSLVVYTGINVTLNKKAWDPYPFILLNLFLSMLAAIQAPVIMMSQNRQDTKDGCAANSILT